MTMNNKTLLRRCAALTAAAVMLLASTLVIRSHAQDGQALQFRLRATPSVTVSRMDRGAQRTFADNMAQLTKMFEDPTREADYVTFSGGLSIAAYENIPVQISITTPEITLPGLQDIVEGLMADTRITWGYLNDGTTFFMRAMVTNESPVAFRLRNNGLLRRSMRSGDPLFIAHVFFIINQRKEVTYYGSALPVPTVTVEFL
jgi:hypothetical protein